jgi:hypothetical protein
MFGKTARAGCHLLVKRFFFVFAEIERSWAGLTGLLFASSWCTEIQARDHVLMELYDWRCFLVC